MERIAQSTRIVAGLMAALLLPAAGCSTLMSINGIPALPAHRVPASLMGASKSELQPISLTRLRRDPPAVYQLGPGDVLGVYIENVLGDPQNLPPVNYPEDPSRPPAIGYPVPVRDDGTIALPLVPPLKVEGLTLIQTTDLIRKAYTVDRKILQEGQDRILVSLIRRRMYRVLVVREESGGEAGVAKRGTGHVIDLPAYENDLLHALNLTGGLPGLDAKNEILIVRGAFQDGVDRDRLVAEVLAGRDPCRGKPILPEDPTVVKVPLRFYPNEVPQFTQDDIILNSGDIVVVQGRDEEKFYTGGLLGGGEYLLPRDRDLDVLQAIAMAGGPVGGGGTGLMGAGGRGTAAGLGRRGGFGGIVPPTRVIILRKTPSGGQVPIRVNLHRALTDPGHRVLIQPEDVVLLRYTLDEAILNSALNLLTFNVFLNDINN